VTVDIILYRINMQMQPEVLLIKRAVDPFKDKWAIPGGHFNSEDHHEEIQDPSILIAAQRELWEEVNVMVKTSDFQLITWLDAVGRDPRGRYITFVFQTMLPEGSEATAGSDAKELKWFKQDEIAGQLAFDHEDVLTRWFKGGKHINQLPLVPIILVPTPTGGLTPMR
jgi:ADP-ribose pyrophosphatase YjhB (NUDIX family)